MLKFIKLTLIILFLATNAVAGSDGELKLSKKSETVKDCFEPLNRATFALTKN